MSIRCDATNPTTCERCGSYLGHSGSHTALIATEFLLPRRSGFVHCDVCGENTFWTESQPMKCRCGMYFGRTV